MPSRAHVDRETARDRPAIHPRSRPVSREDRVTRESPSRAAVHQEDRVTSQRHGRRAEATQRAGTASSTLVLPSIRQILSLAAPDTIATLSVVLAFAVASMSGVNSAVFIFPLVIPGLILGSFHGTGSGYRWRESVGINLATMLVLFPLLIIRQNTVRVPYLDFAHGTAYAAMLSTGAVLVALIGLAVAAAWISREDPESAAMLFLPAALLVPLLTSATEFAQLESALLVAGMIFVLSTLLTLIASVAPHTYVVFVAPFAIACEVLFVTLVRQDRIFPVGVNEAGMALFATVVVSAIALVVMLPSLSAWMGRVDRLCRVQQQTAA